MIRVLSSDNQHCLLKIEYSKSCYTIDCSAGLVQTFITPVGRYEQRAKQSKVTAREQSVRRDQGFMLFIIIITTLLIVLASYKYVNRVTGSSSKMSPNVDFSSPSASGPQARHFTTPNNSSLTPGGANHHQDCHTPQCPSRGGLTSPWPLHTPHHHIGVRPGVSLEDDNHSDAEIQSFPIDYLPERSALSCSSRLTGGGSLMSSSGHQRILVPGRALGPSHAHCANCGSGQALPSHHSHRNSGKQPKRAPDVPKRTVSRLTSLDVGESSELYPRPPDHRVSVSAPHSRTSSSNSSPRVPVSGSHVASPAPTTTSSSSSGKPRTSQSSIPSRPKEMYHANYAVNEVIRKRHYRTGLNIFNKKPERGIHYLIGKGFLDNSPQAVARFLMTRKGLAKQMIGEYLGNISSPFNQSVLHAFANEMDLANMPIDVALRKFQTYFRYLLCNHFTVFIQSMNDSFKIYKLDLNPKILLQDAG